MKQHLDYLYKLSVYCVNNSILCIFNVFLNRLVDIANHYYDLDNFPNCEAKRVLEKLYKNRDKDREESKNRK